MIQITCRTAASTSVLPPIPPLRNAIARTFARASRDDIDLQLDETLSQIGNDFEVDDVILQRSLASIAGHPSVGPVTTIGLIFAGRYKPKPSVLGIMFDAGFDPAHSSYDWLGRQGCAVLLGEIARVRHRPEDYAVQVAYTTTHELGHVFNLFHARGANFMATSGTKAPPADSFRFLPEHQRLLSLCSTSRHIQPGGSPWNDLDSLVSANVDPSREDRAGRGLLGVELQLDVDLKEFWAFEPVELEVSLRLARGTRLRSLRLPDVIDPCHDEFVIWIEDPRGERRRYRRTKIACGIDSKIHLTRDRGFDRDISLFGEAGGYTFRTAGLHRVWAVLETKQTGRVQSNTVELNVLPLLTGSSEELKLRAALGPADRARLMFYRSPAQRREAEEMELELEGIDHLASGAAARYTVGRVLQGIALASPDCDDREHLMARGHDHLARAAQHDGLSRHRRALALTATQDRPSRRIRRSPARSSLRSATVAIAFGLCAWLQPLHGQEDYNRFPTVSSEVLMPNLDHCAS